MQLQEAQQGDRSSSEAAAGAQARLAAAEQQAAALRSTIAAREAEKRTAAAARVGLSCSPGLPAVRDLGTLHRRPANRSSELHSCRAQRLPLQEYTYALAASWHPCRAMLLLLLLLLLLGTQATFWHELTLTCNVQNYKEAARLSAEVKALTAEADAADATCQQARQQLASLGQASASSQQAAGAQAALQAAQRSLALAKCRRLQVWSDRLLQNTHKLLAAGPCCVACT